MFLTLRHKTFFPATLCANRIFLRLVLPYPSTPPLGQPHYPCQRGSFSQIQTHPTLSVTSSLGSFQKKWLTPQNMPVLLCGYLSFSSLHSPHQERDAPCRHQDGLTHHLDRSQHGLLYWLKKSACGCVDCVNIISISLIDDQIFVAWCTKASIPSRIYNFYPGKFSMIAFIDFLPNIC